MYTGSFRNNLDKQLQEIFKRRDTYLNSFISLIKDAVKTIKEYKKNKTTGQPCLLNLYFSKPWTKILINKIQQCIKEE